MNRDEELKIMIEDLKDSDIISHKALVETLSAELRGRQERTEEIKQWLINNNKYISCWNSMGLDELKKEIQSLWKIHNQIHHNGGLTIECSECEILYNLSVLCNSQEQKTPEGNIIPSNYDAHAYASEEYESSPVHSSKKCTCKKLPNQFTTWKSAKGTYCTRCGGAL